MNRPRLFKVHVQDNVATLLDDVQAGVSVHVLGADGGGELVSQSDTTIGHKLALRPIAAGEPVIKYGVVIGTASCDIAAGEWVHLHNLASNFDARSQTLDLHTGAATDTRYE
jgi:altronate dehydratase small subunit